ncbi:N-acetyltransferase [Mesorhizobium sp. B2-2-4]|uniref:DapH/DapD/GlmU-related protein n=1 Tax=unclassified Mesorhizobium TaxID=325217 RepID=UPI00112611AC|nr:MULTISPECIES: DapH/DapD/GlmU-related protein [unclassified Mesorhizobium]TPM59149.1 N-acetyltransferase [Mesorhizobium sp. B2-2-4]TPM67634.1 N-acetyltransferase [Mesorhizobium sp. B2-2-1]TPN66916.1 N-acetyltransferase [Mesorhizobium sp. B1-1-3]
MIHHRATIHPKAHVDPDAVQIGAGSKVWQFATVIMGTVLGEDCSVGACAVLTGPIFGDRCKISSGVVMGPGFQIGNDVFVGPNVVLANDCWPSVDVGGYDDAKLRDGNHFAVRIENGAMIGANAVILPGVTIGAGAVVAACSRVTRNVPPGGVWRAENGYIAQVPADWRQKRMRLAKAC